MPAADSPTWPTAAAQVFNGALANVDSRSLANGPWTFQLTVVDMTGNYPEPCPVTINVQN